MVISSSIRTLVSLAAALLALSTFAMPTKEELAAAKEVVDEVMAPLVAESKKGTKTPSEVADGAMELEREAESDAEKFALLSSAASYYARGREYDKAADAVEEILSLVPDIPPSQFYAITASLVKAATQRTAPRLVALNRSAAARARADQQRKSVAQKLKAQPRDAELRRSYAELSAVVGDWDGALKSFAALGGEVGRIAAAETDGTVKRGKIADFWWSYKPTVDGCADAMREHAAALYKAALDDGEITGLARTVAEKRVSERLQPGGSTTAAATPSGRAATLKAGAKKTIKLPGGVTMEFAWCPPGTFMMGSPSNEENRGNDEAQHRVTLTKGFWLGKYEVTQKQWQSVMGSNPSSFKGDNRPVEQVSWNDCQEFIQKMNALVNCGARLPTEAEWEYACRAGTTGAYAGDLNDMAWYYSNSGQSTHDVGTKQANAWGLHDMHGNVWERCQDWKGSYVGDETDPKGPASGVYHVMRGGSYRSDSRGKSRSAHRDTHDDRSSSIGFRVALAPSLREGSSTAAAARGHAETRNATKRPPDKKRIADAEAIQSGKVTR